MIVINGLLPRHIDQIHEIECQCFSVPWSKATLTEDLSNTMAKYFVLEEDDMVRAYLGVRTVLDEIHIMNIAVAEDSRGKGFGKALLDELSVFATQGEYKIITLEARQSNVPALSLYGKYGFERCGMRSNYYERPTENAVLMVKNL